MKNNLPEKFYKTLKIFVDKYKKNPNVIAILVSGSYIHSTPDKNSDLDVHVLLEKAKMRERGNTWIDGFEIEYFINPVNQIRYYFETETGDKAPRIAHMFVNSEILYQKDRTVNQLIKEAKAILRKKMPAIKKYDLEFARYHIDDTQKDLEDVFLRKDIFAFSLITNDLLQECLEIFLKVHRIYKEKPKRLQGHLKSIDENFEKLYTSALIEKDIDRQYDYIKELVNYTEKLIGGKRPKEWILRSECNQSKKRT